MDKKGETGFYIGLAILSLILVVLGAKVVYLDNAREIHNKPGMALQELLYKEFVFKNLRNYLDFSFRFAVLESLNNVVDDNEIWDKDPKEDIKIRLIEEIKANFLNRIEILKSQSSFEQWNFKYPVNYQIGFVENKDIFIAKLKSEDELVIDDLSEKYPKVVLHDNLEFEHEINFNLSIFSKLYEKYSKLETAEACKNVKENELFEMYKVKCTPDDESLNFEVETNDLGLVKPIIKFKIEKPGKIGFTNK